MTTVLAHRTAMRCWLDELDAAHGAPSAEDLAAADRLLDEVFGHSASDAA